MRRTSWCALVGCGTAERLVGDETGRDGEGSRRRRAPVTDGQEREPGELGWREVELLGCSEGAERHWGGGSTEGRGSPEKKKRRR